LEMTKQVLSNAKTNFNIHLNNAITKRNYLSRMKRLMKCCQVECYDEHCSVTIQKLFSQRL
jgi:hypothetical protein